MLTGVFLMTLGTAAGHGAVGKSLTNRMQSLRSLSSRRALAKPRAQFDIQEGFKTGILSANQQKVFISEEQLKTSTFKNPPVLENVEKMKLLSTVEDLGLLSLLEESGITLSAIESAGLLSLTEDLGVLSTISKPETLTALYGASLALSVAAAASLALPSDNAVEGLVKTTALAGGAGGALASLVAARALAAIQGQGYSKVGTDGGIYELSNLADNKASLLKRSKKEPTPLLSNVEKLKLLSQVEKSGLLSKLEKAGISLSKIEKLKLLSTAEKAKILSLVSDPETPGKLAGAAAALAAATAAVVAAVPDDDSKLVAAQAVAAAALGLPAVAAAVGSGFLSTLQKPTKA